VADPRALPRFARSLGVTNSDPKAEVTNSNPKAEVTNSDPKAEVFVMPKERPATARASANWFRETKIEPRQALVQLSLELSNIVTSSTTSCFFSGFALGACIPNFF
jgi:hypothetical protein